MNQQSLKLLRPMVKDMHYQENTLFDLDPKVKEVKVTIRHYAQPDLGSNGLQRLSADHACGHRAKAVTANARPFFHTKAE